MSMRKGPPYKVYLGNVDEIPPTYVSAILSDKIVVKDEPEELARLDIAETIPLTQQSTQGSQLEVTEIMMRLHRAGAVFYYDPKAYMHPGAFMLDLQDKGILKESFFELSWINKSEWKLLTHELK